MPPIHLAIREGHIEVVRYLAELGGVNPKYRTDPYVEPLLTVALDRGFEEIAAIVQEKIETTDPDRPEEENSIIEFDKDEDRIRFEKLVSLDATVEVEQILKRRPELAQDPFAFWSEGVLSVPANHSHREMIETLLRYGAKVPRVTKWGARYYFKHHEIGEFLLDNGMDANHMNCHHTTLLHEMGFTGDVRKARLLIEHGAEINAIDEEFRSTPLGFAARWGKREVLELLLESGAELNLAGAEWATPLAWAQKKGHSEIVAILKAAGAR